MSEKVPDERRIAWNKSLGNFLFIRVVVMESLDVNPRRGRVKNSSGLQWIVSNSCLLSSCFWSGISRSLKKSVSYVSITVFWKDFLRDERLIDLRWNSPSPHFTTSFFKEREDAVTVNSLIDIWVTRSLLTRSFRFNYALGFVSNFVFTSISVEWRSNCPGTNSLQTRTRADDDNREFWSVEMRDTTEAFLTWNWKKIWKNFLIFVTDWTSSSFRILIEVTRRHDNPQRSDVRTLYYSIASWLL